MLTVDDFEDVMATMTDVEILEFCRKEMELPPLKPKKRACLRCERMFNSDGAHNRICVACKDINKECGGYG